MSPISNNRFMRSTILSLSLLSLLILLPQMAFASSFDSPFESRIVNADRQGISVPYQVGLAPEPRGTKSLPAKDIEEGLFCGGTLVSPTTVVTAAHCISNTVKSDLWAFAGVVNRKAGSQGPNVKTAKYSEVFMNDVYDIAIIKLKTPLAGPGIAPLPMALSTDGTQRNWDNRPAQISGWGQLKSSDENIPFNLRQADIKVLPDSACKVYDSNPSYAGQYNTWMADTQLCAQGVTSAGKLKGPCYGDSGGPLVDTTEQRLIGIVAFGNPGCTAKGYPAIYTDISSPAVTQWINQVMAGSVSSIPRPLSGGTEMHHGNYIVPGNTLTCTRPKSSSTAIFLYYQWETAKYDGRSDFYEATFNHLGTARRYRLKLPVSSASKLIRCVAIFKNGNTIRRFPSDSMLVSHPHISRATVKNCKGKDCTVIVSLPPFSRNVSSNISVIDDNLRYSDQSFWNKGRKLVARLEFSKGRNIIQTRTRFPGNPNLVLSWTTYVKR